MPENSSASRSSGSHRRSRDVLATLVPYRVFRHQSYLWLGISVALLAIVYFFPAKWGSRRWIPLGFMNFQPSELAKLAFILAVSRYLDVPRELPQAPGLCGPLRADARAHGADPQGTGPRHSRWCFCPSFWPCCLPAGRRLKHLALIGCVGAAVSPVFWLAMNAEQKSRITALFLQRDGGPTPTGDGYHLHQSKQVLALGGLAGSQFSGTAVDDPLAYHLPACRTDFVICMIGERWGLAGTLAVLALYLVLFGRGL